MARKKAEEKTALQAEWIGNYLVREPLSNKNAGFSLWGFGEKDGKRYFLKQYLTPVFPSKEQGMSETAYDRKMKSCERFQKDKFKLFTILNASSDGNLLRIHEFFRYDSKYYVATEAVDAVPYEEVRNLPQDQKLLILLELAHAMMCFHSNGLVHGDMKPDNILFRRTASGKLAPVIIDIDNCFYRADPPRNGEEINADQVYMSPETFRFIREEPVKLSEKIDVFALGLIFHEILCGRLPGMGEEKAYPFSVLLDGGHLDLSGIRDTELSRIIERMLRLEADERISMDDVFEWLQRISGRTSGVKTEPSSAMGFFHMAGDL